MLMSPNLADPTCSGGVVGVKLMRHAPSEATRIDNRSTHPSHNTAGGTRHTAAAAGWHQTAIPISATAMNRALKQILVRSGRAGIARRVCCIGKSPCFDASTVRTASTPKLLAKLTAVEVEAAAASGAAGRRRFDPMRPRGAVRDSRSRWLRLAARRAVSVAVQHLGGSAGFGDT